MTYHEALVYGAKYLSCKYVDTNFLDSSIILRFVCHLNQETLLNAYSDEINEHDFKQFTLLLEERLLGKPIAYITNTKEFYGLSFFVDERVLIPRADTEILVESALNFIYSIQDSSPILIHDICTGSGAIILSIEHELKNKSIKYELSASDISEKALEVARLNAKQFKSYCSFFASDLLGEVAGPFSIITANPPYVSNQDVESIVLRNENEPLLALSGGFDGLDLYKRIIPEAKKKLKQNGVLIMEIGCDQAKDVKFLLQKEGFKDITVVKDYAGNDRVVRGFVEWKTT